MGLEKLLERPSSRSFQFVFGITLIVTFILSVFVFGALMAQFPPNAGLMDIKNAWNKENMEAIVQIWTKDSSKDYVAMMGVINAWDFAFMFIYGTALFSGMVLVTRKWVPNSKIQRMYLIASVILPVLAVGTDFIEGVFIAVMLGDINNIAQSSAFGASLSTFLCMIFLYSGVLLIIIGFLATARKKK